jgi:hypothetical protein
MAVHVAALSDNHHFSAFIKMLGDRASNKVNSMIGADLDTAGIYRMQGEIRELVAISDAVSSAADTAKQYELQS